jgi:hypothetical protein
MICRYRPSCYNPDGRPLRGGADRNDRGVAEPRIGARRPLRGGADRNQYAAQQGGAADGRPLRGGADRNLAQLVRKYEGTRVAPCAGARIETW